MKHSSTESGMALLGGALAGAAVMYLLDPTNGERRRSGIGHSVADALKLARDHALATGQSLSKVANDWAAQAGDSCEDMAHDWSDKAKDAASSGRSAVAGGVGGLSDAFSGLSDKVSGFGHDLIDRVRGLGSDASDQASDWASTLAGRARSMSHPARHKLAASIDPDHVRGPGHAAAWSAAGVGMLALGGGLMYFLDPSRGAQRRDRVLAATKRGLDQAGTASRNAGKYWSKQVKSWIGDKEEAEYYGHSAEGESPLNAEDLVRQCRMSIGRVLTVPTDVQLMADTDGAVTIDGRVPESEQSILLAAIRSVPGVNRITNRLETFTAGSVSSAPSTYSNSGSQL